jgi:hypothetical protein
MKKKTKEPNVHVSLYHLVLIGLALIGLILLSVNVGYKRGLDQCGKGYDFKILYPFAEETQGDAPVAESPDAYN